MCVCVCVCVCILCITYSIYIYYVIGKSCELLCLVGHVYDKALERERKRERERAHRKLTSNYPGSYTFSDCGVYIFEICQVVFLFF